MQVTLPPALEAMVLEKVASGLYRDVDEVLNEALRRMIESDAGLEWLRRGASAGFDQLDTGEFVEMSRDEFLTRSRQRHAA